MLLRYALLILNGFMLSGGWIATFAVHHAAHAQDAQSGDPIFSGPQVGEPLPPLRVRGVLGEGAGDELDYVPEEFSSPIVLVFVHDVNRPSIAMTRTLTRYALGRAKDGLLTRVVLLGEDATSAEQTLLRIQHALAPKVPIGVSLEGREGPGAYGLNRLVQLTVLVANRGKVTANYALVQPSLQADLPKILQSIVDQIGGDVPDLKALLAEEPGMRGANRESPSPGNNGRNKPGPSDAELRSLLRPFIQKDATDAQIDAIAKDIEAKVEQDEGLRREIGRIASTIARSDKLSNYGTPRTQEYLKQWAEKYGPKDRDAPK